MSEAETETNPIDRAVAHLLFHRPLELSGKHTGTPESPASVKFPFEHKSAGLMSLPMGCVSDNSQVKQNLSHQASKVPSPLMDSQPVEQFKNSPCIDTSENASTYGPADGAPEESHQRPPSYTIWRLKTLSFQESVDIFYQHLYTKTAKVLVF
ncbi:hypothetical protein Gorai_012997 [Gossypium raimondii]|uniref:Uncharacterized protein n=1 Tax=Gossypium raimondii TaxID=29730 RepID=A0A7J8Q4H2_GOSRA|nr:hypothetical protein [Gossypium raimondii]